MKKTLMVPRRTAIAILTSIILSCFVYIIYDHVFSLIVAYLFWLIGMVFSIKKIRRRFTLFSFNIGFFVFLLGGFSINYLKLGDFSFFSNQYFTSSLEANIHTCVCMALCMICVNCGYFALSAWNDNDEKKEQGEEENDGKNTIVVPGYIKQILFIILCISYLCRIIQAVESFYLVKAVTYYESVSYLTTLPAVVIHIGSLYFVTLFMYLATFPSTGKTIFCVVTLLILELITLAAGSRGEPISIFLLIIFYIFLRNRAGINDIVITKKMAFIGLLFLPVLMYTLQALSYTRNSVEYTESFLDGVTGFIETQGVSAKIIANSYDLDDKIYQMTKRRTFILGEIRYYFKSNVFTRLLTGKSVTLRTIEDAFSGDNYLRSYGYAYAPATYIRNVGAGSTYVAEAFYDGGYLLLMLMNLLISYLLAKIDGASVHNFITCAILMNVFRYMPTLARGMMLDWLTNTFAIQNLIYFLFVYLLCQHVNNKRGS